MLNYSTLVDEILHTRTPSRVSRFILETFGTTAELKAALLSGTGLEIDNVSDLPPTVSIFEQRTLIENTTNLLGEDWVLRHIKLINYQDLGIIGSAISTAPTFGDGLDVAEQLAYFMAATLAMNQIYTETHRHFAIGFVMTRGPYARHVTELSCAFFHSLIIGNVGEDIAKIDLWLSYDEPSYGPAYKNALGCGIKFGKPYTAFVIPKTLCAKPSTYADAEAHAKATDLIFSFGGGAPPPPRDETVEAVRRFLKVYSGKRPASEDAAAALRLSRRSLSRKLRDAGTSFRDLLDQSLKERAALLEGRHIYSRGEIAEQLGYSDVTSYGRARRRWHMQ